MSSIDLVKTHYSSRIVDDVVSICEPLKKYGVDYFVYARYFDDGSLYTLMTRKDIYFNHFHNQYKLTPYIPDKYLRKKFQHIVTLESSGKFSKAAHDFQNIFKIKSPIYFFERYEGYFDLFIYALNNNKGVEPINFYLNNMELFEKFKFYFKDKANKLIKESYKNRIIVPDIMRPSFAGLNYKNLPESKPINYFVELTHKHYILEGKFRNISLAKSELETLRYVVNGYTFKEAAKNIGISPRTVESNVNNARLKLGIRTRFEIANFLSENGLDL